MENDEDYDEVFEEIKSKVVYKRSSPSLKGLSRKHGHRGWNAKQASKAAYEKADERHGEHQSKNRFEKRIGKKQAAEGEGKHRSKHRHATELGISNEDEDHKSRPLEDHESRPLEDDKRQLQKFKSRKSKNYFAVTKYEVDYTNQNYVRSKCNKNLGHHRYAIGRIPDWDVIYDNNYYLQSKVNAPKGLHRIAPTVKRKRIPDDDFLADSTGWEFEYGPEFNQLEGDIPFMPEERTVTRGGYRFYGVRRNYSDSDLKTEETREPIKDLREKEFRTGAEFLQDDIPHMVESKDRRIDRGGYRFYDASRNINDYQPVDPAQIDYVTSKSIFEEDGDYEGDGERKKGKPFKRTLLKKTTHLQPKSAERLIYTTHLSFMPGKGVTSYYEEKPTTMTAMKLKKHPSIRNAFRSKKKSDSSEKLIPPHHTKKQDVDHKKYWLKAKEQHAKISKSWSSHPEDDSAENVYHIELDERENPRTKVHRERRGVLYSDADMTSREAEFPKEEYYIKQRKVMDYIVDEFPEDVQKRIISIRKKISQDSMRRGKEEIRRSRKFHGLNEGPMIDSDDLETNLIDLEKHKDHPHDRGQTVIDGYEKYTNEDGNEIWIKTKKIYSELHHRKH